MKKFTQRLLLALCIGMLLTNNASLAHSGRTDSSGGHHDNKNASGLGSYHYHCGGHPAHLHPNGVCPYSSAAHQSTTTTKKVSKYYRASTVRKVQNKLNKLGYKCGKADGAYGSKTKAAIKKFQKKQGMSVNGKINKTLLKKLKINIS